MDQTLGSTGARGRHVRTPLFSRLVYYKPPGNPDVAKIRAGAFCGGRTRTLLCPEGIHDLALTI